MARKGPASVDRDNEMMTRTGKMNSDKTSGRGRLALALRLAAAAAAFFVALSIGLPSSAGAASRIKDIVDFEGIRENQLVGYGLVVGLNGTGDSLSNGHFTKESLQSMLNRLGASTSRSALSAMPTTCWAARFWSRRCSVPTARSMPWRRASSRSAASPPRATPKP